MKQPPDPLLDALESALADLETRHDMERLALHADGNAVGPCPGCGTCRGTLPKLRAEILKRLGESVGIRPTEPTEVQL